MKRQVDDEINALRAPLHHIARCRRCGEDAFSISLRNPTTFKFWYFVRVRRSSKCKNYKGGQCGRSCNTELRPTEQDAIREWNQLFGGEDT